MARYGRILVAAILVTCPREAWGDIDQLLEKNQQLRDRIFTIRATVLMQGTAGLPLPTNRKYVYEIEWLQKGDLIRVDYVIGEVRDGIRNVTPKHTFVYRDGTRTVFHTAVGGPEGRTNIFEIDPPNQPVPPHSVWRLALFEFWSNRFDDPKGPGRISYQKAAKLANTVGIERIELKGPRTLLFVLKENATEEIEFDESGLIVSQVTTHGSDEHRIAQKVTAVERSDGIPLPKRITTRSWDLKRPGSPLVQQGSTEIWVHAINQDVPDSEFAVPDIYPRTQIDYRDQSIRAFDKDGKELYSVPIRSAEQIHRDLTPLPPEPFSWWPTVAALALLAGIGLALLAWRRSTQSA